MLIQYIQKHLWEGGGAMRPIELTPRLLSVAHLVPLGARLADVGTDHAYLPAYLLQQGIIDAGN